MRLVSAFHLRIPLIVTVHSGDRDRPTHRSDTGAAFLH